MAFYKSTVTADTVKESGGKFIGKSGIYPVTIKIASVKINEHGARSIDFNVDYEGSNNVLYGLKLDNNDGTPNYQARIFDHLCIIADLVNDQNEIVLADPEIQTHKIGKDQTPTDLSVLTEFTDLEVKVWVKEVYSLYKNELKSKKEIVEFYRADGASASEIVNGTEIGIKLAKDSDPKYCEAVTYKDGLTAEKVAELKKAQSSGRTTAAAAPQPKKNLFA